MKRFEYQAIDKSGKPVHDFMNSNNEMSVRSALKLQGLFPTLIYEVDAESVPDINIVLNVCRKSGCKHFQKSCDCAILQEKCKLAGVIRWKVIMFGDADWTYNLFPLPEGCDFDTEHIMMQYSVER